MLCVSYFAQALAADTFFFSSAGRFADGVRACPASAPLRVQLARHTEVAGGVPRARTVLDKARAALPAAADVWLESVRLEERAGNHAAALAHIARALQACPKSGALWAASIRLEELPKRRARAFAALTAIGEPADPLVLTEVARLFARESQMDKARDWFRRAVDVAPENGDAYCWLLRQIVRDMATPGAADAVKAEGRALLDELDAAAPRYGELWISVAKGDMAYWRRKPREVAEAVMKLLPDV